MRAGPIEIDGVLDEAAWTAAAPISGFVEREPIEGARPEEPTEVRVLFDEEALYVGARLHESNPDLIARQLVRRDDGGNFDSFELELDTNLDGRTGYRFRVSAAGVQGDDYLYDDEREDDSWDAVWSSAVSVDSAGWTAEMRIPLSQIRYGASDEAQTWGVNFSRQRIAAHERVDFALRSRERPGRVSQFGRLTGLVLPHAVRKIEVKPYALGKVRTAPVEAGNPFFDGSDARMRAGADVRYGLGSAFSLDATFNPDFGQVEVDPAVVNLSAFETFFPEKRPFFVEDARIFDFSLSGRRNTLFYSRRIGREPRGSGPDDADFTDTPGTASILGAAKLTGRTASGLSVGGLVALTQEERGRAFFLAGDSTVDFLAEPRTGFAVARVQQDLGDGASQLGGIVTALDRSLPDDGSFDYLPGRAFSGGLDFEHTWSDREWAVFGFLAGTLVEGTPEAMLELQQSSSHYFQRPDARGLDVDSTATSLRGAEWRLQLERRSGRHWTGSAWLGERTPGFDSNGLGFFQGSERLDAGARLGYQEIDPGTVLRSYRIEAMTFQNWRHEALRDPWSLGSWAHAHKNASYSLDGHATFLNYWWVDGDLEHSPRLLDDAATRGGPLMVQPASWSLGLRAGNDRRSPLAIQPSVDLEWNGIGGSSFRAGIELTVRPSSRLEMQIQPEYSRGTTSAQYVTGTDDLGYDPTYGPRYIFADLRRHSLSMETRLNVTFTRTLTLQLFAQPLLSSGDYTAYKQLARPESFEFLPFTEGAAVRAADGVRCDGGATCVLDEERYVDADGDGVAEIDFEDGDFFVRSLRGNAVLRWEYRPGSTLYLVWQQSRYVRDADPRFDFASDASGLFATPPENVLILKASYWLGI